MVQGKDKSRVGPWEGECDIEGHLGQSRSLLPVPHPSRGTVSQSKDTKREEEGRMERERKGETGRVRSCPERP